MWMSLKRYFYTETFFCSDASWSKCIRGTRKTVNTSAEVFTLKPEDLCHGFLFASVFCCWSFSPYSPSLYMSKEN